MEHTVAIIAVKMGEHAFQKMIAFYCLCPERFKGQMCEVHMQCWQHSCLHGATCVPSCGLSNHRCVCPIGWKGDRCETGVNVSSAYFSGASYLLYQDGSYKHRDLTKTSISFNFSSVESSGLLLWNGKIYSEDGDYLGIGLSNNHLHVVWNLGWLSRSEIITDVILSGLNSWHHVYIDSLDIEEETLGYFSSSFVGCIKDLTISEKLIHIMDLKEGKKS
ncbi:protein eyes shut homolog [Caerostris extrusa]|uniref:Protein eyes shut homolog n=1 Tax=Caerostris extrusa TaxID=172846 RepID=A0AAV4PW43_CAEEX|nr:protein eyes shut homolog [Caerostris extrusa]